MDPELLQQVFERLVNRILTTYRTPAHRSKIKLIDSATVALCLQKYKWATFRKSKAGIKLHMRLAFVGEEDVIPEKATITNTRKNDRTQLDELVDEPVSRMYLTAVTSTILHSIATATTRFTS